MQLLSLIALSLSYSLLVPLPSAASTNRHPEFGVRLVSGPAQKGDAADFELAASRTALLRLKDELGPPGLLNLLNADIEYANSAWKSILANSTGGHVPAVAHLEATGLNASAFLAWFSADTGDPHKMIGAHPDHYVEEVTVTNGITSVNIVEAWGYLVIHYTIPNYGNSPKKPWMDDLPDYPYQALAWRPSSLYGCLIPPQELSWKDWKSTKQWNSRTG
jgi:hypothetical protein